MRKLFTIVVLFFFFLSPRTLSYAAGTVSNVTLSSTTPNPGDIITLTIKGTGEFDDLRITTSEPAANKKVSEMKWKVTNAKGCENPQGDPHVRFAYYCSANDVKNGPWMIQVFYDSNTFTGGTKYDLITYASVIDSTGFQIPLNFGTNSFVVQGATSGGGTATGTNRCSGNDTNSLCTQVTTELGEIPTDPLFLSIKILNILLSLSGGIFLLLIIRAGYRMIASQGNPEAIKDARESLISAIVGFLFLIFSFVILELIGVHILQLPGWGA